MRIVLLGATGFVGAALLSEALSRGHEVMAIARHPEKLEGRENLAVKAGDVYDTDGLASLIAGHDALISAFNPGWTPGTQRPEMYDEQVRGNLIDHRGRQEGRYQTGSLGRRCRRAGSRVRREGDRLARFPGVDQARLQSHKQRPGGTPERAGARMDFPCPFCGAGTWATDRKIPPGRRPASGRCQGREQDLRGGLCGGHAR